MKGKVVRFASAQDDGVFISKSPVGTAKQSMVERMARKLERRTAEKQGPRIDSFEDFLANHARVKNGAGYVPYHFAGREALKPIVERLDLILAAGEPDVSLALCGGAQFGKTVLMLNLLAYLVAVRFRNVGYYLPDDDLVSGLVDGKLRPDVLDQIPWLARLIAVGKTLNASGRAVNRKGAFLCTDGKRTALAFMRGLGKIPTSFSMDVVIQDEKDDLSEEHARFLPGRMTASDLRLSLIIGTQRYHGAGQNLAFTEGTQHVGLLTCPGCGVRLHRKPGGRCPECGTDVAGHVQETRSREERIERIVAIVSTVLVLIVFGFTSGIGLVEGIAAYAVGGALVWFLAKRLFF